VDRPAKLISLQDPVSVTWVSNILDPVANRKTVPFAPGATLGAAMLQFVPLAPPNFEVTAWLNGEVMPVARHDIVLLPGDNLVMAARPQGGGGGGSNPLAMVAMIAVIVVASIVTAGVAGAALGTAWGAAAVGTVGYTAAGVGGLSAMGAIAAYAAGAAVMAIGGYLVSSSFKAKQPDFGGGGQEALGSSPSFSWQAQGNPLAEGTTLPVLYGRFLVTPPLIARHVESGGTQQYLNMLYALAGHRIEAVEKVLINDQPIEDYKSTVLDVRMGDADQGVIPYFGDLKEELAISAKLTTEWTQRELPGSLQGMAIGFAYRLYYANDKGGMDWVSADVYLEYRMKGQTAWTRYHSANMRTVTITNYRWSAGYMNWRRWVELAAGSSNYNDHRENDPYYPPGWTGYYDGDGNYVSRPDYYWTWRGYDSVYAPGNLTVDFLTLSSNDPNQNRYVLFRDYLPEGQYEVRVRLVSALTEDSRHGSDVYWDFAQMIQYDDFTYPCTAVAGVRALATDQIAGGQPVVKFLMRRDYVWVYDADAKKYVQKAANNPAWACYDCLHNGAAGHPDNAVYGLGIAYGRIVYADFLDWANWCDKKGYTVNIYIESPLNGKATLDMLGLMGRGTVIQVGSRFTCTVDKPRDLPRQTFLCGLGNMVSQTYTKEWLPMQERANVVELTYFDADANYQRQTVEIYQDGFDTSGRAIVKAQRTLYGCVYRQDALTFGRALMLRNRYLTFMPSFETGVEAIHCLPGDPVDLAIDELQGGASGRVVSADSGSVTLDCLVAMLPGEQYALELQDIETDDREYAYLMGVAQETETDTVTLLKPLAKIPPEGTKYGFGKVGRTKKTFTVLDMQTASDQRKRLHLLEYIPEIYDDAAYAPDDEDWSMTAFIRDLRITEIWRPGGPDGSGRSVIGLSWRGNAVYWNVFIREHAPNQLWSKDAQVVAPVHQIERGLVVGRTYDVRVSVGAPEIGVEASITLRGKMAPPNDVRNFRVVPYQDMLRMDWDHIPDADLWGYQIRVGATWDTGLIVLDGVQENSASWGPPMDGTYRLWIKAIDDSGIFSVNAAEAHANIDISTELNIVWRTEELPDKVPAATLDRLVSMNGGEELAWIPSLTDTDFPPWYTDGNIPYYCGDTAPGVYTSQAYDLGVITPFSLRLTADFTAILPEATDLTYPARTDMSYPADTDLSITSLSVYAAEYRISNDGETWSAWAGWTTAQDVTGRWLQLRVVTVLDSIGVKFRFTRIAGLADVPDQSALFAASVADGGTRFTIEGIGLRPMIMEFHVGVTVLGSAALFPVVEMEDQAFTVRCFDVLGSTHAAETNIEVRGF
jgi:hypothetical protein